MSSMSGIFTLIWLICMVDLGKWFQNWINITNQYFMIHVTGICFQKDSLLWSTDWIRLCFHRRWTSANFRLRGLRKRGAKASTSISSTSDTSPWATRQGAPDFRKKGKIISCLPEQNLFNVNFRLPPQSDPFSREMVSLIRGVWSPLFTIPWNEHSPWKKWWLEDYFPFGKAYFSGAKC